MTNQQMLIAVVLASLIGCAGGVLCAKSRSSRWLVVLTSLAILNVMAWISWLHFSNGLPITDLIRQAMAAAPGLLILLGIPCLACGGLSRLVVTLVRCPQHGAWSFVKQHPYSSAVTGICITAYIVWAPVFSDMRLPGVYAADYKSTAEQWVPFPEATEQDVANIVGQIFEDAPVRFSNRTITMKSDPTTVTHPYIVMWKYPNGSLLFMPPVHFFHVIYTGDGIWMKMVLSSKNALRVKFNREAQSREQ